MEMPKIIIVCDSLIEVRQNEFASNEVHGLHSEVADPLAAKAVETH